MELNQYQGYAQRTSRKDLTIEGHFMNAMLGLAGEAGECCDLAKKHFYQDGRAIYEKIMDELGDVLWYIAEAATSLGISMDDIATHNVKKLMDRYPDGFDAERSLHREGA